MTLEMTPEMTLEVALDILRKVQKILSYALKSENTFKCF